MTNLDWICAVVLFVFSILGFRRGLIGEVVRVAAVLVGLAIAFSFSSPAADVTNRLFPSFSFRAMRVLLFVFLFVSAAGMVALAGFLIKQVIRLTLLGWVDRLGGTLIGAAKGLLLVGFFVWLLAFVPGLAGSFQLDKTVLVYPATRATGLLWNMVNAENWRIPLQQAIQNSESIIGAKNPDEPIPPASQASEEAETDSLQVEESPESDSASATSDSSKGDTPGDSTGP